MFPDFKDGSLVEQMTRTSSTSSNQKAEVLSARLDQDQRLRVKVTLRIRSGTLKGGKPGNCLTLHFASKYRQMAQACVLQGQAQPNRLRLNNNTGETGSLLCRKENS